MSGLLSAISGQFTKALILGTLFPAAVFVLFALFAVVPLLPPDLSLAAPAVFGSEWNVLAVTFVTLLIAGVLFNLETPLVRMYEGYPWEHTLLGRWRAGRHRRAMEELQARSAVLFELVSDKGTHRRTDLNDLRSTANRRLRAEFPENPEWVLPTRLGNVLRASERYPSREYGINAIQLWPRLVAVIPEGYAVVLADARTTLIFLVNLSFLTAVLAAAVLAAGLAWLPPAPLLRVVLPFAGFAGLSAWLYAGSVGAAAAWGQYVRGAFDLYRWELLKALGFEQKPRTRDEERALWSNIWTQMVFGDDQTRRGFHPRVRYADPAAPATSVAAAKPKGIELQVTRGIRRVLEGSKDVQVVVVVENADPGKRTAEGVTVTDTLPAGMGYRWDSAAVDGVKPVAVSGTGPYRFRLPDVPAGGRAVLTYTMSPIDPYRGRAS